MHLLPTGFPPFPIASHAVFAREGGWLVFFRAHIIGFGPVTNGPPLTLLRPGSAEVQTIGVPSAAAFSQDGRVLALGAPSGGVWL